MKTKRILVPTDFSEPAKWAESIAMGLAKAGKGQVTFLHVLEHVDLYSGADVYTYSILDQYMNEKREAAAKQFRRMDKKFKDKGIKASFVIEEGDVADHTLEFAQSWKADIIVCGNQGQGLMRRMFVGSTALKLARFSPVPLLVADGKWPPKGPGNIVVALDLSLECLQGLPPAIKLAKQFGTKVMGIHVMGHDDHFISQEKVSALLERTVARFLKEKRLPKNSVELSVVRSANISEGITKEAKKKKSRLLVSSSQGHRGVGPFVLGSFCERLLRDAEIPVLVIPKGSKR